MIESARDSGHYPFEAILEERQDEITRRMRSTLIGLNGDWVWMDDRIETVSAEIEEISQTEENCVNAMTEPGIGPTRPRPACPPAGRIHLSDFRERAKHHLRIAAGTYIGPESPKAYWAAPALCCGAIKPSPALQEQHREGVRGLWYRRHQHCECSVRRRPGAPCLHRWGLHL